VKQTSFSGEKTTLSASVKVYQLKLGQNLLMLGFFLQHNLLTLKVKLQHPAKCLDCISVREVLATCSSPRSHLILQCDLCFFTVICVRWRVCPQEFNFYQ